MDFRLAVMQDLAPLKDMYRRIVKNMETQGLSIWDDSYPCEFLEGDIQNKRLYVLLDNGSLVSAFALCDANAGARAVQWKDARAKALYLDRLGVDIHHTQKGIGRFMLVKAKELAKISGAEYLRLFVVDINEPAIKLYTKYGFVRAAGVYAETFEDGFTLREYGYETEV